MRICCLLPIPELKDLLDQIIEGEPLTALDDLTNCVYNTLVSYARDIPERIFFANCKGDDPKEDIIFEVTNLDRIHYFFKRLRWRLESDEEKKLKEVVKQSLTIKKPA